MLLVDATFGLHDPWPAVIRVVIAAALAVAVLAWSDNIARWWVARSERTFDVSADTAEIANLKRRETAISLASTTIRYVMILILAVVVFQALAGGGKVTAVAGASLLVVLIGFACQRLLTDILTGAFMLFEGWYAVGDLIIIEPFKLEGVVEELSLRATTVRSVTGESIRIHNSQVLAVRRLPRGIREMEIELFCTDEERGRSLVEHVSRLMPTGPMQFVRRPRILDVERLDDDLVRVRARCATAAGREWLAQDFLPHVLKERAGDGLIVHGPVVTEVDVSSAPSKYFERFYGRHAGAGAAR
jgi:moderate conductance mechanosensitive channel